MMPFFYEPNRREVISRVSTCVSDSVLARYEPFTSVERNAIKNKLDFPHRLTPELASRSY